MSRIYDNWGRLVNSVLRKEHDRELAYAPSMESSFNSSTSDGFSSRFSFDFEIHEVNFDDIPSSHEAATSSSHNVLEIAFEELEKATINFRADLVVGEGGFGRVYKGWINESTMTAEKTGYGTAVAVKNLNPEGHQGKREWMAEIKYLSQLRHPNLVKLIGYSSKEDNMLLVYEFVAKGSLDNHLFGRVPLSLSWRTRIKVAIDVAKAFSFLHGMQPQVIHRGCVPFNILLDEDFNAKLSDFGLAMNGPTGDMTYVTTEIMGTICYVAPEYVATGRLTAKCDVYGFGVVLLELLSGRRAYDFSRDDIERNLVDWAKPYLGNKKKLTRIMDTKLAGQYPVKKAYSVASLALNCLSSEAKRRPRMSEAVVALEQLYKVQ